MTESVRAGKRLRITDDLLPSDRSNAVTRWHAKQSYSNVWSSGTGVRALFDGPGHFASTLIWNHADRTADDGDPLQSLLVDTVRSQAHAAADLIGTEGTDWTSFTLTPWVHEAGTQLGWHTDRLAEGPHRVGAFVWYVHPRWDFEWGGEFNLIDEKINLDPDPDLPTWQQPDVISYAPDPIAVVSRPNRMIIFPTDTYHCVRRIDRTAGDRVRRSITGFFMA